MFFDQAKVTNACANLPNNLICGNLKERFPFAIPSFPSGRLKTFLFQNMANISFFPAILKRWTFGFLPQELPGYLLNFGLTLVEDVGATEYRRKYLHDREEKGL